jgi:hypothetical protein
MISGCLCGKRMFQLVNEGTCCWCGHGEIRSAKVVELRQFRRVSRDLGSLNREGRRPARRVHYVNPEAIAA